MNRMLFIIFLFPACITSFAQIFKLDSLPAQQPTYLTNGWKWHAGDNIEWAKKEVDDSQWENFNPGQAVYYLPQLRKSDNGWLRLTIDVDSAMVDKNMVISLNQVCATQLFLDGKLINQLGTVGDSTKEEKTYFNLYIPQFTNLSFAEKGLHTLAIRYSFNRDNINHFGWFTFLTVAFTSSNISIELTNNSLTFLKTCSLIAGLLLLLFIFFVLIYKLGNDNTFNLNIVFYSFCTWTGLLMYISYDGLEYRYATFNQFMISLSVFLLEFFFLNAIYILFNQKRGVIFYSICLIQLFLLSGIYMFFEEYALHKTPIQSIPYVLVSLESLRVCFIGIQKKQKGANIIFWGQLMTIIAYFGFYSSDISFLLFQKIITISFVFQTIAFAIYLTASPITIAYLIAKDFVDYDAPPI